MSDPTPSSSTRKGRGCLFYGCLTVLVLLLLVCVAAFFAVRWVRSQVTAFTDGAPITLPKVEMADGELKELEQRAKAFGEGLEKGKLTEPLILSEREINALILKAPNARELADRVYVTVTNSLIKGQVSMPLGGLGWFGKGRYLNGEATFNVSLANGVLIVTAREVKVKGRPLPETFMSYLRQENLAKDAYKDPKNAEALSKLESLEVQGDHVTLKARPPP